MSITVKEAEQQLAMAQARVNHIKKIENKLKQNWATIKELELQKAQALAQQLKVVDQSIVTIGFNYEFTQYDNELSRIKGELDSLQDGIYHNEPAERYTFEEQSKMQDFLNQLSLGHSSVVNKLQEYGKRKGLEAEYSY